MRTFKQRVLVTLAATILAAACGILAGWLVGRLIVLKLTERRLLQVAVRASMQTDSRLKEATSVLAAMQATSSEPCSPSELTYFRALIFDARYLKDAGRMSGGTIACSASLARPSLPMAPAEPDITVAGSTNVYKNLAPYQSDDQAMITLRYGDFFVVLIPYIQPHMGVGPEHYAETVKDGASRRSDWLLGDLPPVSAAALTRDGLSRQSKSLYATRCSARFPNCVTAYLTIAEALQADHAQIRVDIALGGLTGAFLGLFCSIIYRRSRGVEQQLRRAIRQGRMRVVYQPIVSLPDRRIVGAEALSRWSDEEDFAVSPEVFIKIAEERGFIGEITRLVVRRVLGDFAEILRSRPGFHISINVAAADLADPQFLPMLDQALEQAGVPASSLVIEITETSTAVRQSAVETIRCLHQRGHSVHIDDFGTGYSSLSYLHDLSVDAIKIDKSFTQAIGTEAVTISILPQVLGMAKSLNLGVVVEGIETSLQASYFTALSQPFDAQGWLFGRPVPVDLFRQLLVENENEAQAAKDE